MTTICSSTRLVLSAGLLLIVGWAALPARAQDINKPKGSGGSIGPSKGGGGGGIGGAKPASKARPSGPASKPAAPRVIYRDRFRNRAPEIRTETKVVYKTKTTGSLTVTAEPGAKITLYSQKKNYQGQVAPGERSFIFNDLPPGEYDVDAELPGYTVEPQTKLVKANISDKVDLAVTLITYDLKLTFNVPTGSARFREKGRDDGAWMAMPIQNSAISAPQLRPGEYEIAAEPGDRAFEPYNGSFSLTENKTLPVNFKRRPVAEPFSGDVAGNWRTLPAGWKFDKTLYVNGAGVLLPREEKYRHYTDFHVCANVKMRNERGVSFALRAADENNYYLVQITGEKSDAPYVMRGFVVKNGVAQPFGNIVPVRAYADQIKDGKYFLLSLSMLGNRLKVKLKDTENADISTLGVLTDASFNFSLGSVGVAGREREDSQIGQFVVTPITAATEEKEVNMCLQ
jgi:hypothetical protein